MTTSTIIIIALAWCLANIIIALLHITCTGDVIGFETIPVLLLAMVFNIIPVFIVTQLIRNHKKKTHPHPVAPIRKERKI